jgi:hypothetical protein
MTSRREFLLAGLTSGAFLALSAQAPRHGDGGQSSSSSNRIYKAIFDERFAAAREFAQDMQRRGIATHAISGDVTALWYHDLHFAWSKAPIQIAGVTTAAALFCLETLARDAGHRVTHREPLDHALVSWTIAPRA